MTSAIKAALFAGVALCGGWPTAALAQSGSQSGAPAPSSAGSASVSDDDIVVTARRREERLQDVPVAVTAFSSAELAQRSTRDIVDLGGIAPNLQIGMGGRGGSVAVITLRGQENVGTAFTNDPAVGIYFDEVYLGRSAGSLLTSIQDMAGVQVLRGPQGTLFGRNNTGGAILLTPNRPNLSEVEGSADVTVGRFNRFEVGGVIDLPIVEGKLGIRASVLRTRQDGFGRSVTTGFDRYGNAHSDSGRVGLRWKPSDSVTFDVTYDKNRVRDAGQMNAPLGLNAANFYLPVGLGFYETRSGLPGRNEADIEGIAFRSEVQINPDLTLKTIIGGRRLRTLYDQDVENGPLESGPSALDVRNFAKQHQWTAEVQLSGTALRDATPWLNSVSFTGGFFYFYETGNDGSIRPPTATLLKTGQTAQNFVTNRSAAGYLQVETNSYDKVFVTLGTRYTRDHRDLTIRNVRFNTALNAPACNLAALPASTPVDLCFQSGNNAFHYFSYTAGVRYQFSRDANLYFKYDKAQRSGGLDDTPVSIESFAPEIVNSFEVGAKLDLLDRRLRTNFALFSGTISNLQRNATIQLPGITPFSSVYNAAKGKIRGAEAEITAKPADGLTIAGTIGYIDAFYKEFSDPRPTAPAILGPSGQVLQPATVNGGDISNYKFTNTPKWTYSITGTYEVDLSDIGSLLFRADYTYRSHIFFQTFNIPGVEQDGYGLLNGRVQLDLARSPVGTGTSIAVFGRNLTGKKYDIFGSETLGGYATRGRPREWGAQLSVKF